MINEKRSFSEAVLEEAQGITFDVVDACEEMSCGEGRLCELHEPLFLETCLILEDSKRLKTVNVALRSYVEGKASGGDTEAQQILEQIDG